MSRSLFALLALAGGVSTSLFAGVIVNDKGTAAPDDDKVPLNLFNSEYNFVNSSSLHGSGSGNGQGDQNASFEDVSYSRRIQIKDNFYFRIGVDYQRYDFGSTNAPAASETVAKAAGSDWPRDPLASASSSSLTGAFRIAVTSLRSSRTEAPVNRLCTSACSVISPTPRPALTSDDAP